MDLFGQSLKFLCLSLIVIFGSCVSERERGRERERERKGREREGERERESYIFYIHSIFMATHLDFGMKQV